MTNSQYYNDYAGSTLSGFVSPERVFFKKNDICYDASLNFPNIDINDYFPEIKKKFFEKNIFEINTNLPITPEVMYEHFFGKLSIQSYLARKILVPIIELSRPIFFLEEDDPQELTSSVYAMAIHVAYELVMLAENNFNFPTPIVCRRKDGRIDIRIDSIQETILLRIGEWNHPILMFFKHSDNPYIREELSINSLYSVLSSIFKQNV